MLIGIWNEFLHSIREEAGSRIVETWFKAISLDRWDAFEKVAYLRAPNSFVKDWVKNNYRTLIELHLKRLLNVDVVQVNFIDVVEQPQVTKPHTPSQPAATSVVPKPISIVPAVRLTSTTGTGIKVITPRHASHINSNYIFSNFIVGPSNSLAHAAAHAVTEKPGNLYNPLFIYGGSGLGKTHLLHAIGNEIKEKNKQSTILYQTADRFVNEFISAIRFDRIHKFQAKYRDIDVLLIDDVQFISNKEQTQEAFFHIFNALYDAHKQIVFSSDSVPQNIQGLAERLRSRLAWGLVTDIVTPSLETKVAILKKKADGSSSNLPDDVACFIASLVVSNIRELEGALCKVLAYASLTKQEISLELARTVLARSNIAMESRAIDFERIIKQVEKQYNYSIIELQSKNRNKELVLVRQITMYLLKKLTDKSLRDIGLFMGARDHSTVLHAVEKIEAQLLHDTEMQLKLKRLEESIVC